MKTSSGSRFAVVLASLATFGAVHSFAADTHTVTFRRLNGTVLLQTNAVHGANATAMAPALPAEAGMTAQGWDHADWLACVTNDVTCWALYEASTAMSPSTSIASASVANRETPYSLEEYFQIYDNLAWSDEFSGSALSVGNGMNWQNDTEKGGTELQTYTSGGNHSVSDGTLKLTCRRESSTRITSARIITKGKVAFLKGRCEIRAKITKANGAFPAFWTMGSNRGWPWGGEIDVFEQLNGSDWITGSLHMPRYPDSNYDRSYESGGESLAVPEDGVHWGDGFHRIGIIVNERDLVWYVDDYIYQRMDIRDSKYDILRNDPQFVLLNYAFGGSWSGVTNMNQSAVTNFTSEDFEVDYCRIFTNTNENNTVARTEPMGARLSGPVKATVWRGWQMRWGKSGASYYQNHLISRENLHIRTAMREYFGRDNADIVTFLTRTTANSGGNNLESPVDVPGYTAVYLSPNSGRGSTNWDGDIREKLLGTVLFNRERFSKSDSAVGTLQISNDYNFTNGCAVVAELVERDTGAKVKVVSAFVSSINEATTAGSVAKQGFDALISKLDAMKDEKVILLIQGWNNGCLEYLNNRVSSELASSYSSLGQYTKPSYVYQSAWVTANYAASAENPEPLSVPKSNGQASGVHTNQAFCATVQFEAEPAIEYGQLDQSAFEKKMTVSFTGYSGAALTDFPVLVKLSTAINGFSYADFHLADGGDLRFADSNGTLLPHEIDTWNPDGVSTVWVKVPSLTAAATITACYGCDEPPAVAAKDVWDDDYVGVWHLGETILPMKESSATSVGFTQSSGSGIGFAAQGIVGGSVDFGESGKTRALIAPDNNALDGFTQCTFEAWTYVDSTYRASGSDVNKGFLSKRINYNNQASYYLHDTGSATKFFISSSGTSSTEMSSAVKPDTDAWTHQAYTFDGTTSSDNVKGWKNGANVGTASKAVSSVFAGSANLILGNFSATDARNYPGRIDELRISKVARSADWIKATHDTVANANFATYAVDGAAQAATSRTLPFKRGTNCRGLDVNAYSSSTWSGNTYIYGLDSTYTDIKAKGFDYVRFSVDLTQYYDGTGDQLYTSGSYDIGIIDTFIQKFLNAGLSVHLLMGRFEGGDIDVTNADHREKFKKVWQRVAEHYADRPDSVAFELCNEPHGNVTTLNNLFRDTVALIRQTNPTRMILWPTGDGSQPWMLTQAANPPNFDWVTLPEGDTNIAVVVHTYAPADFTHQGANWTYDGNGNPRNYHTDLTDAYRAKLREDLKYISQYAQAHPSVPIVLNEFGVMCGLSYASDAHEWLSTVREFCEARSNIAWAHFEYTDFNDSKQMASRSHPTGDTWRTNVVDALFPKGWDDQPLTYGQLDMDSFSKKLQVSFTGYAGTETLANFPLLVKLSTAISGFSYGDFQMADGGDLRFADSTGRQIPHEIDTWNPNGESTVWVRVPSLTASTRIYACYGCATPPAVTAMDVWDDDYVGVWHLNEGGLPLCESSHRGPSFTQRNGQDVTFASTGVVGGSVDFGDGMSNAVIAVDHENLDGFEKFTIEVWTKQSAHKTNAGILSKRTSYGSQMSYYLYDAGTATRFYVSDAGTNVAVQVNVANPNAAGSWQHQACSIDTTISAGNVKGYLNGGSPVTASQASGRVYDGIAFLTLGNLQPVAKDNSFNGSIDEVRISKCVRSADWIKATHDTVANAAFAVYTVDGAQPPDPPVTQIDADDYAKSMDLTFSGYSGSELTDFPVLVKLSTAISGFSYADFTLPNGGDLRFADANGNLLPHEIDTWNESGVSTVWVKVPRLTPSSTIKAYYGCTGTPPTVSAKDVWDDGYVAVWHLGESAVPMKESSETTSDFTTTNGTGIAFASQGIVGGSVDFSSGSKCSLVAPDHDLLDGFEKFTIEVWTRQETLGTNLGILSKRNTYMSEAAYYIMQSGTQTPLYMQTNSTDAAAWISAPFPTVQAWNHLAYAIDTTTTSGNVRSYKNGGTPSTSSKTFTGAMLSNGRDLVLGNLGKTAGNAFNGKIDEVRISNVVRSGDWIKATHDTVSMSNFATYSVNGYQPENPDRILYVNVDAGVTDTLNASLVTAYVTNIVKQGAGTLVASSIPGYTGDFTIEGGVYAFSNAGDLGAAGSGVVDVKDGASLEFRGGADDVLSGKTINLYGAKAASAAAKVVFSNTANRKLGTGVSVNLVDSDEVFYNSGGKYITWASGTIDLGGHELRLKATGNAVRYEIGASVQNGGTLVYEKCLLFTEAYAPTLAQAGASGATLRLENAALNLKKAMNPNGWNIVCSNSFMTGNIVKFPQNTGVPNWEGAVQFLKASSIANYTGGWNVSNTVFNLKGAVSGSGTLNVGPGWLNLHSADNTYSGSVTISGQNLTSSNPILAGGGGIGLWNGAACFPDASSVTFTNTARLAFMDNTACTVPNVTFVALADETQSISGGVYTARSTMAGFTKTGAGTLVFDSPVSVTGTGNVQAGTLKVANLSAMGSTVEEMVAPQPVFSTLAFASGTTLDLSGNYGFKVANLVGSPAVTNAGVFGVMGSWTLSSPVDVLTVTGENVVLGSDDISGMLAFASGATFTLADEVAFSNAVEAAGADGLVVARARWMLGESNLLGMQLALPTPAAGMSNRWSLSIGDSGTTLRLKLAPATGYAAWVAEKGVTGGPADKTGEIENAVRYAFDIDPQTDEIGDPPIIQVVMDESDNPAVRSRDLAEGRDDVTFGILATEDLGDWSDTALVPMEKSVTDGLWRPAASENPSYVYPAQMFFKYTIEVQ